MKDLENQENQGNIQETSWKNRGKIWGLDIFAGGPVPEPPGQIEIQEFLEHPGKFWENMEHDGKNLEIHGKFIEGFQKLSETFWKRASGKFLEASINFR